MDRVSEVARAVLYEGYILWPYRRSAPKNRQRWTFGGVFPEGWSASHPDDIARLQVQCLVEGPPSARVGATVRFLHAVERRVSAGGEWVDELEVDGERYLAWDEATERDVALPPAALCDLHDPVSVPIDVPAGRVEEPIGDAAALVRSWRGLEGTAEVRADELAPDLHQLTVRVRNATPWDRGSREDAQRRALMSTHVLLHADGGEFVSLTDPPDSLSDAAGACENRGTWPVLVGDDGDRSTLLAAPIILSDYPQVAPESPGDMFDAGEIDQMLVLNVLAMTEAEQREMCASDPRAREIFERCAGLSEDERMRLHGTIRDFQRVTEP